MIHTWGVWSSCLYSTKWNDTPTLSGFKYNTNSHCWFSYWFQLVWVQLMVTEKFYSDATSHWQALLMSIYNLNIVHARSHDGRVSPRLVIKWVSLVPGIHGRENERLVSAICACVKLTIFNAPLFCMMQPYLLFSVNTSSRSIAEEEVKQSPHGHFSMASSHCILRLCRLGVRPRLMRTHRHCHCKWPLHRRIPK